MRRAAVVDAAAAATLRKPRLEAACSGRVLPRWARRRSAGARVRAHAPRISHPNTFNISTDAPRPGPSRGGSARASFVRAWALPMSGRYHGESLTDGVPVRSMKQLFELALQLEPPWRVVSSDLDFARRRVDLRLGFRAGSRFPCPQCGRACEAVEFTEGTWRQPDMMAFEAFVTARLPSVRCAEHGDVALTPSWASDHVSLRDLIRNGNADQLRDAHAHRSSRRARPPESPGQARR